MPVFFPYDPLPRLPIDLVEPCPARAEGDHVPCHLFLPDVAWPEPVGPVIRMRPRREYWLVEPPVRVVAEAQAGEPAWLRPAAYWLARAWLGGALLLTGLGLFRVLR